MRIGRGRHDSYSNLVLAAKYHQLRNFVERLLILNDGGGRITKVGRSDRHDPLQVNHRNLSFQLLNNAVT